MLLKFCTRYASKFGNSAVTKGLNRTLFTPISEKGNSKESANYRIFTLISHTSKAMIKILQVRLPQYMNGELPDVQAGFRKGGVTKDQIANICRIIDKAKEFQKNYFCFIDYGNAFGCVDHNKLWKFFKGWKNQTTLPAS